jgi:hypothetical protein
MLTAEQRKDRLERKLKRKQQRIAELRERWAKSQIEELLDETAACVFIGGSEPINAATLWRGIRDGRFARPIKIGRQKVRWRRHDLQADLDRMAAQRAERTAEHELSSAERNKVAA